MKDHETISSTIYQVHDRIYLHKEILIHELKQEIEIQEIKSLHLNGSILNKYEILPSGIGILENGILKLIQIQKNVLNL